MSDWEVHEGDALEVLREMPEASVDSLVTDPPAGISFMGKTWDHDHGGRSGWVAAFGAIFGECLRVLKPGGHALVWAIPRTSHWTATALEDAGFEIRDVLVHIYGSGFPKSLDVSKAIDKAAGESGIRGPMKRGGERLARLEDGKRDGGATWGNESGRNPFTTIPTTDAAKQWQGWGTALKPATEHWILARKPLIGTVAANVLEYGTGALNVNGCRVGVSGGMTRHTSCEGDTGNWIGNKSTGEVTEHGGRWPPNLLLTHSAACGDECAEDCPVREMDRQSGELSSGTMRAGTRRAAQDAPGSVCYGTYGGNATNQDTPADSGGASRFFPRFRYVAKASSSERNAGLEGLHRSWVATMSDGIGGREHNETDAPKVEDFHPTVKPIDLMRWLCRLVTPPGGLVLDPFLGSGSTMVAALQEGFRCIGIEREHDYVAIARRRVEEDMPLFNRDPESPTNR